MILAAKHHLAPNPNQTILHIGDSMADILAAQRAGVPCLLLARGRQSYVKENIESLRSPNTWVVNDFNDLRLRKSA